MNNIKVIKFIAQITKEGKFPSGLYSVQRLDIIKITPKGSLIADNKDIIHLNKLDHINQVPSPFNKLDTKDTITYQKYILVNGATNQEKELNYFSSQIKKIAERLNAKHINNFHKIETISSIVTTSQVIQFDGIEAKWLRTEISPSEASWVSLSTSGPASRYPSPQLKRHLEAIYQRTKNGSK